MKTVTRSQAEKYLAAVRVKFSLYVSEMETTPDLVWGWNDDGHAAIVWEDGPFEWAAVSLDERYTGEYGYKAEAQSKVKGVFEEPYYTFVMMLYPED